MIALLATLPLQLVCHLIAPGFNGTNLGNQSSPQDQPATLPDGYVPPAGENAILLASLPLQVVCQLIVTSKPGVTEDNTLVGVGTLTQAPPETRSEDYTSSETTIFPDEYITSRSTTLTDDYASTTTAILPEGYVTFPEDGVAYKIHEYEATWYEAREICILEGAHLAITDSVNKIVNVRSLTRHLQSKWLHVGILYSKIINKWIRVDNGLPVTSIPWASFNSETGNDCTGIALSEDRLIEYNCEDKQNDYFVCEISM